VVDTSCICQTCGKHFSTTNAYNNHLQSKKHRETVAKQDQCLTPSVQRLNAKNEEKTKDATHSGNQLKCESKVTSGEMGAVGGVAESEQQEGDIGTTCLLFLIYLIVYINSVVIIFWIEPVNCYD